MLKDPNCKFRDDLGNQKVKPVAIYIYIYSLFIKFKDKEKDRCLMTKAGWMET